jgi:hypothetical protein
VHPFELPRGPVSPSPAVDDRRAAFDEFLVGYADREAVLDEARRLQANAGGGILKPTIVVDGRVVGTWKRRLVRGGVVFSPATFAPLAKPNAEAVARALQRYEEFLGVCKG